MPEGQEKTPLVRQNPEQQRIEQKPFQRKNIPVAGISRDRSPFEHAGRLTNKRGSSWS